MKKLKKMFCCRGPPCLDEAEPSQHERQKQERLISNGHMKSQKYLYPPTYVQPRVTVPREQHHAVTKETNNRINNMVRVNPVLLNPQVKHVTNVQRDIHVKLSGYSRQGGKGNGFLEPTYSVVHVGLPNNLKRELAPDAIIVSGHNVPVTRSVSNVHTLKPRPTSEGAVTRIVSSSRPVARSVSLAVPKSKTTGPKRREERKADYQRTSTPVVPGLPADTTYTGFSKDLSVIKDNGESDSLTDQQKDALDELDDTLKNFQGDTESDEEAMPKIIADVLPYGQFEPFNMADVFPPKSPQDIDEPSSRTSSMSNKSINSRTGIISKRASTGSATRKSTSVSFRLPDGHVDKPYMPMQVALKNKMVPNGISMYPEHTVKTYVTGSDIITYHNGNGLYYHDNVDARSNSNGPFKGSFMKMFYGKYAQNDISTYANHANYLTPKISEKVESFENLSHLKPEPAQPTATHRQANQSKPVYVTRRHTFR